jgi:hypothetical protein
MNADARNGTESHADLIPPLCIECGYALRGLPNNCNCPECGAKYGTDVFVLSGWGFGWFESIANSRPQRMVKLLLLLTLFPLGGAIWGFANGERFWEIFLFAYCLWLVTLQLLKRRSLLRKCGKPYHVRICPKDFAQRIGFGPPDLSSWSDPCDVKLDTLDDSRHRLTIRIHYYPVNSVAIEFECSESRASHLRRAMTRFRAASNCASRSGVVK